MRKSRERGVDIELFQIFPSTDEIQAYIQGFGPWAPVVFFLLQIAQVILAPIPGNLTALMGGTLFGVLPGFLLSSVGIFIGSSLAFGLTRRFGKPLALRFISEETYDRYNSFFHGRSIVFIFLVFLIPFFPKDAFCFLAGLSNIRFLLFSVLMMMGRLPGIYIASLAGAGFIDFPWWIWAIIAIPSIILIALVLQNADKIEAWFYKQLNGKKNGVDADPSSVEQE